ncbi:MAG: IS3 family transposase [Cyanobacteria bacterium]|nr:IS3 family transposase [Cyanobacteriota bacterium]
MHTASKALSSSTQPLDGARSGCNAWRQWQEAPGERAANNAVISAEIEAVFEEHRGFYGSPRIHQELRAAGCHVGLHRVARLMRLNALRAKTRRAFRPCTKATSRTCGVVENLLQQDFQPPAPNLYWAGDITYIRTSAGWRYLAVWIDLYSRRVVGWKLAHRMDTDLVMEALNRALGHRRVEPEQLIIHTDQGSQYRASDYRKLLKKHEISCSMSAKGCCWDNAVVESFFPPSNLNWTSMTMLKPCSIRLRSRGHWPSGSRATTTANAAIQRSVSSVQSITSNASRRPLQSIL